ncbi:protein FAM13A isoform X3 [Ambystoma mexicanum]|uniref:protein FAM13A isoform X3 n=1 Tax=Ambystoma mexicanum TaxID=8296 RepID=UPI0037E79E50
MQPTVVNATDCSLFLDFFKQSKAAVKLREDMKKIVNQPMSRQTAASQGRMFGVPLLELQKQGRLMNGVPHVVWNIVEYLKKDGLTQEGIFRVNGSVKVVEQLRLKYDSGEDVDLDIDGDVFSAASLLKLFLRELPDGVVTSALQPRFLQLFQDSGNEAECEKGLMELLQELPDLHRHLLKYLCQFLKQVAKHHFQNRMNIFNLATVFGPNCFHVPPGFEGIKEQGICNKIMAKLLADYNTFFESGHTVEKEELCKEVTRIITVKEVTTEQSSEPMIFICDIETDAPKPSPRRKEVVPEQNSQRMIFTFDVATEAPKPSPRRKVASEHQPAPEVEKAAPIPSPRCKLVKAKIEGMALPSSVPIPAPAPQPGPSGGTPQVSLRLTSSRTSFLEDMDLAEQRLLLDSSTESITNSKDDERPMSPFYMSTHTSQATNVTAAGEEYLERTIRSAVEQHIFDGYGGSGGHSSEESESGTSSTTSTLSARQRRRHLKEQDETWRNRDVNVINKENIPSMFEGLEDCILTAQEAENLQENISGYIDERIKPKRQKSSTKLSELIDNQDSLLSMETLDSPRSADRAVPDSMEVLYEESNQCELQSRHCKRTQVSSMKIQGHQSNGETRLQRGLEAEASGAESFAHEVPRLDLTSLSEDNHSEEPVTAFHSWLRDTPDPDEARLSPQAGRLIQQLLDVDSDPMLSPRFYAYGHSHQFLDDTEVPPSPPNSHPFMRRRSSSLGSCDEDHEELSPAQLTRKIQGLKKKIRKFEDRFEEERKYRPSHSDKAANSEVLKWMNELSKFRKQLKESKLKISEEDLAPQVRQRSNTLPKSFFSQLVEDRKQEAVDKAAKPTVEATLESIQKKLQEKRAEMNRSDDIKDMTREEIASEKVSLQKSLLYYESVHGRPVTKIERQVMKPLYDRYRLVKQILYRASTIPVIEEEDGSDDESNVKEDYAVTMKASFSMRSFLEQLEDDPDGFISPIDDKAPSKGSQDLGLSNLHSASIPELMEQLHEAREEKKKIRKKLREFEEEFFRQNGRNVQKEDRSPMLDEYSEYKQMKAKMRLLEVLISKSDSSKTI